MKKIDALAELAPEKVIEMYAARFPQMPAANRAMAIEYLRFYSKLFYSPEDVPSKTTNDIDTLEAKQWPVAQ